MTRKSCIFFVFLQMVLFGFLLGVSSGYRHGYVSNGSADLMFSTVGPLFVVLAPFGLMSLFLSLGFMIFLRIPALKARIDRSVSEHPIAMFPVMFLVWRDLRAKGNFSGTKD